MTQDKAQEAMVESLMSGTADSRERFIIETLLDIKANGCAQRCLEQQNGTRPHFVASGVASAVATAFIAIIEYIKAK